MLNIEALRGRIVEKGYTQITLSEAMGLSRNTISAILTGKKSPTLSEVEDLCIILDIDDDDERIKFFLSNNVPISERKEWGDYYERFLYYQERH